MEQWVREGKGRRAPEHTPEPCDEQTDLLQRQWQVFFRFCKDTDELAKKTETYITDYSPRGCIPFSVALYRLNGDEKFLTQAQAMKAICKGNGYYDMETTYLHPSADVIVARLKNRARSGDEAWSEEFIRILCEEYDKEFYNESKGE